MNRILVRHLSGSKANQTEFFSLDDFKGITFGRDDSANVKYDAQRDDLVSRQHARIDRDKTDSNAFTIDDLKSSNGTFVNKSRIHSPTRIKHGDIIQFGADGPEFVFELDPPPSAVANATRIASKPTRIEATRVVQQSPPVTELKNETRQPGRLTSLEWKIRNDKVEFEGQLQEEKHSSRKQLINVTAALIGVVALVSGAFIYREMKTQMQLDVTQQQLTEADNKIKEINAVMTPQKIAEAYSGSIVTIESGWELVDTRGRKIYHLYEDGEPVYSKMSDGTIEPVPTADSNNGKNKPIAGFSQGTGFAITQDGFMLTNRHVAAPWRSPCVCILKLPGKLYEVRGEKFIPIGSFNDRNKLEKWKPRNSPWLKNVDIEGRHIKLNVTFPKTTLPFPARLVRESDEADVALLKIDTPDLLQNIPAMDVDRVINPGDSITVMGYPAVSPDTVALIKSKEPDSLRSEVRVVPNPTITSGLIGKVIKDKEVFLSGDQYINLMGDVYQLTVNATGEGNSGGPVFDDSGHVIGIFSYKRTDGQGTSISFAVPIKYGRNLKFNPIN